MYIIYKVSNNVNDKIYIGYSSKSLSDRKRGHKYVSTKQTPSKFYAAIRKYGWDSFTWEVIYQSLDKSHCLEMEKHFIAEYDSICSGYNIKSGGDDPTPLYAGRNGMFGKTHTPQAKLAISAAATKRLTGKSYEELYGKEKADKMKLDRSELFKTLSNKRTCNPRYDKTEYSFYNDNGDSFNGTRMDFYTTHKISKSAVCGLIKGKTDKVRGWSVKRKG